MADDDVHWQIATLHARLNAVEIGVVNIGATLTATAALAVELRDLVKTMKESGGYGNFDRVNEAAEAVLMELTGMVAKVQIINELRRGNP